MYVNESVSKLATTRSPGAEKSAAENKMPVVPPLVLLLIRKAPPTVAEPLMLNTAGEPALLITEGSAVEAAAKVQAGRVPLLYAVTSVQPA